MIEKILLSLPLDFATVLLRTVSFSEHSVEKPIPQWASRPPLVCSVQPLRDIQSRSNSEGPYCIQSWSPSEVVLCVQSWPSSDVPSIYRANISLRCSLAWISVCACSLVSYSLWPYGLCSLLDSPVHGILQMRILDCVDISSFRGSSQPRDWTHVSCISCIGRQIP